MNCDVFAENLTRMQLLECARKCALRGEEDRILRANVYRNHAFEPILSIIDPFLHYAGLSARFSLSSYDDTLSFEGFKEGDLELVWVDLDNYHTEGVLPYLLERIGSLRRLSKAPILVILLEICKHKITSRDWEGFKEQCTILGDVQVFCVGELLREQMRGIKGLQREAQKIQECQTLESTLLDDVKIQITGTRLSNLACVSLAQILGLSLIPSCVLPSLKALILDLDNTLYGGILGEDGVFGLTYNEEYAFLQNEILRFKAQGFLLALCSKNELSDVREMFEARRDFALKWEDFTCAHIGWNPKKEGIVEIAKNLNIGLESVLFIDDNPAEIENVRTLGIKTLLATAPLEVVRRLRLFPQMLKSATNREDALRSKDIQANSIRAEFAELSEREYFEKLEIALEFCVNVSATVPRATELLNKTNQFLSNYTRPTQNEVMGWMESANACLITVAMRDKLSESGIICVFVGLREGENVLVKDFCISCRALGRKLERILFFESCALALEFLGTKGILLEFQRGVRNAPFLEFLETLKTQRIKENVLQITQECLDLSGLSLKIRN